MKNNQTSVVSATLSALGNLNAPWNSNIIGKATWTNWSIPYSEIMVGYLLVYAGQNTYRTYEKDSILYIMGSLLVVPVSGIGVEVTTSIPSKAWPAIGTFDAHVWVGGFDVYQGDIDYRDSRIVGVAARVLERMLVFGDKLFSNVITIQT